MEHFDFLFHFDYGSWLSEELLRKHKKVAILVFNSQQEDLIMINTKAFCINLTKIRRELDAKLRITDVNEELNRLCNKYGYYQVNRAIFPSSYYYGWYSWNKYKHLLCSYLRAWEYIFENLISCDYYVRMIGDDYQHYASKIAVKYYVKSSICFGAYSVMDRIQFTTDFLSKWNIMNYDIYPSDEETKIIKNWVEYQVTKKPIKTYFSDSYDSPKLKHEYFWKYPYHIMKYYKLKESEDLFTNPFRIGFEKISIYIKSKIFKLFSKKYCNDKNKYFYFPLHVTNDSALTSFS